MNNYTMLKVEQQWTIVPVGPDGCRRTQVEQKYIQSLISYDPDTGVVTSRVYGQRGRKPGDALGKANVDGYLQFNVGGKNLIAHRAIWCYMTGAMPKALIDHVNGDRSDNRWANLREATPMQNGQNKSRKAFVRKSRSGLTGAHQAGKRWVSSIMANGILHKLGRFNTREEANAAYLEAKARLHEFSPDQRP